MESNIPSSFDATDSLDGSREYNGRGSGTRRTLTSKEYSTLVSKVLVVCYIVISSRISKLSSAVFQILRERIVERIDSSILIDILLQRKRINIIGSNITISKWRSKTSSLTSSHSRKFPGPFFINNNLWLKPFNLEISKLGFKVSPLSAILQENATVSGCTSTSPHGWVALTFSFRFISCIGLTE